MNNKQFYCLQHNNWFTHVCIACLDDIFHSGFGIEYSNIQHIPEDTTFDDTFEWIESL